MSPRRSAHPSLSFVKCQQLQEAAVRAANECHLSLYGFGDEDGDIAGTGKRISYCILWYEFCGILPGWLFKRFYRKAMGIPAESSVP